MPGNLDQDVVDAFGDEWTRFDQSQLSESELNTVAELYFELFPWGSLPNDATGFDLGCGSGRWAKYAAPRVGTLHCVDASPAALEVARRNVGSQENVVFHRASVDSLPVPPASQDFGYSLGVLHHVPDTTAALRTAVATLRPGAPFLVYLYYAMDNRPRWFRGLWKLTDLLRRVLSRLPYGPRYAASQVIAATVYWPLARTAKLLESAGRNVDSFPLAAYRDRSFYVMRTDALDRFGTRLERRFTRLEVIQALEDAGLMDIRVSEKAFWCAIGWKRS